MSGDGSPRARPNINVLTRRRHFVISLPPRLTTKGVQEPVGKKDFDKLKATNFIRERNLGINQSCQKRLGEMGSSWPNLWPNAPPRNVLAPLCHSLINFFVHISATFADLLYDCVIKIHKLGRGRQGSAPCPGGPWKRQDMWVWLMPDCTVASPPFSKRGKQPA